MNEIKVGDVLRYTPEPRFPGQVDTRWCREGTAVAVSTRDGHVIVADTYWGSMSYAHCLTDSELAGAELLFNVNDYDEVDQHARSSATWEKYAEADRRTISAQHGLQHRWFTRKGAQPDVDMQIANAKARVAEAKDKLNSARRAVEWAEQDLRDLRVKLNVAEFVS